MRPNAARAFRCLPLRNRHCPQCQGAQALISWTGKARRSCRSRRFHLVFTLPHAQPAHPTGRRRVVQSALQSRQPDALQFDEGASSSADRRHGGVAPGVRQGHIPACIVRGGGVVGRFGLAHDPTLFLFPVKALSKMFGGKFAGTQALRAAGVEFHGQVALAQPGLIACSAAQKPILGGLCQTPLCRTAANVGIFEPLHIAWPSTSPAVTWMNKTSPSATRLTPKASARKP